MATTDSSDTGVGITRNSIDISLEARYGAWKNTNERLAPKSVDFLDNSYVDGFNQNVQPMGDSEIRNIAQGGSGASFSYGNEKRIPKKNSDSLTTTYGAGPAGSIQNEFKEGAVPRDTRFTSKGLNYVDGLPGFNTTKYWPGVG